MNVLFVEDRDEQVGMLTGSMKEVQDVFVGRAVDSLEEVELEVGRRPFPYDCAVVDMQIYQTSFVHRAANDRPHTDWGIEALRRLQTVLPNDKVLVLTQYVPDVLSMITALGLEDRLVAKPVHPEKLKDRIKQMTP